MTGYTALVFALGNPQNTAELDALKIQVNLWKSRIALYGYKNLNVFGIDEAAGDALLSERPAWEAVHNAGANVFASGYEGMSDKMGDILDCANILGNLLPAEAEKYHSMGHQIYSYSNPQVGYENPEIYRRNYGLALWKAGYDGAMDYMYQKNYGSMWNDFDGTKYRDQCFTYAASDQIISTIQWEGFREAVDDIRYLSTLLNKIDQLKNKGYNVSSFENFINLIDPLEDLDELRKEIIDKIIEAKNLNNDPDNSAPIIKSIEVLNPNNVKVIFNEPVRNYDAQNPANYSISPYVTINCAVLNSDYKSATLRTSVHSSSKNYCLTANNIRDINGNLISQQMNKIDYYYGKGIKLDIKVFLEGAYSNGLMTTTLNTLRLLPSSQPYYILPWLYSGSEKLSVIPPDMVDWMLVELRSSSNPLLLISSRAGLLMKSGEITDIDGQNYITFYNIDAGNYFISLKHRNHLSIMSYQPVFISENPIQYDFTTGINKAFGNSSLVNLKNNTFGMPGGDSDANGIINVLDYALVARNIFQNGYKQSDLDMNGMTSILDYQRTYNSIFKTPPFHINNADSPINTGIFGT